MSLRSWGTPWALWRAQDTGRQGGGKTNVQAAAVGAVLCSRAPWLTLAHLRRPALQARSRWKSAESVVPDHALNPITRYRFSSILPVNPVQRHLTATCSWVAVLFLSAIAMAVLRLILAMTLAPLTSFAHTVDGQQVGADCNGYGCDDVETSSLLEHKSRQDQDESKGCITKGKYHYPVIPGLRIEVTRWQHCQSYCRVTEGCQFFSFWPDGGCELQSGPGEYRTATAAYSGVLSGPASCGDTPPGAINLLDQSFMYCAYHPDALCCKCGTCCLPYCENAEWTLRDGCNYQAGKSWAASVGIRGRASCLSLSLPK